MKKIVSDLSENSFAGKRFFTRVDLDVPIQNGKVHQDYRLRRAAQTIEYLSNRGAKVILASHLGEPKGKWVTGLSLRPIADRMAKILKVPAVRFIDQIVGETVREAVKVLKPGEVMLLENLRFHPDEEANDPVFSKELAALGDFYVNDAFGTMHKKHASTYGAAKYFSVRLAGLHVIKELEMLSQLRSYPIRPFSVVVGGAKIQEKRSALETLLPKADRILLGGGTAFTFLAAQGIQTGDSTVEREYLPWAKEMLAHYGKKVLLPTDHAVSVESKPCREFHVVHGAFPKGLVGLDIGPETTMAYARELMRGDGTIFWNGPMGVFETDMFSRGTVGIARAMALAHWRGAMTVIGGMDTVAALHKAEVWETEATHVSNGGAASLKYIGGEDLPGLEVLTEKDETTTITRNRQPRVEILHEEEIPRSPRM